jgi:hypothetical protein
MFRYNPQSRGYENAVRLTSGPGYWVNYPDTNTVTMSGSAPPTVSVTVSQNGWVLLGSREKQILISSLQLSDGAGIIGGTFGYDPIGKAYSYKTVINPGEAVWVNVNKACTITIP